MKKLLLVTMAALTASLSLQARPIDRGLGSPKSEYMPKGSFLIGLAGGYNNYNSNGMNGSAGSTFYGIVNDVNGQVKTANVSLLASYFFTRNMSVGARFSYDNTGVDVNSASMMSLVQLENKHVRMESFTGSLVYRAYIPLFNSKVIALFAEGRLNGKIGYNKNYEQQNYGKVGTYADVYSVSMGLYPGVSFFFTNNVAFEVCLPLLEGGYEWNRQTSGKELNGLQGHAFAAYQLGLLGLNLGLTISF